MALPTPRELLCSMNHTALASSRHTSINWLPPLSVPRSAFPAQRSHMAAVVGIFQKRVVQTKPFELVRQLIQLAQDLGKQVRLTHKERADYLRFARPSKAS